MLREPPMRIVASSFPVSASTIGARSPVGRVDAPARRVDGTASKAPWNGTGTGAAAGTNGISVVSEPPGDIG